MDSVKNIPKKVTVEIGEFCSFNVQRFTQYKHESSKSTLMAIKWFLQNQIGQASAWLLKSTKAKILRNNEEDEKLGRRAKGFPYWQGFLQINVCYHDYHLNETNSVYLPFWGVKIKLGSKICSVECVISHIFKLNETYTSRRYWLWQKIPIFALRDYIRMHFVHRSRCTMHLN